MSQGVRRAAARIEKKLLFSFLSWGEGHYSTPPLVACPPWACGVWRASSTPPGAHSALGNGVSRTCTRLPWAPPARWGFPALSGSLALNLGSLPNAGLVLWTGDEVRLESLVSRRAIRARWRWPGEGAAGDGARQQPTPDASHSNAIVHRLRRLRRGRRAVSGEARRCRLLTHVHRASACTLNAVGLSCPCPGVEMRGSPPLAPPLVCVWRNLPYLTLERQICLTLGWRPSQPGHHVLDGRRRRYAIADTPERGKTAPAQPPFSSTFEYSLYITVSHTHA